MQQSPLSDGLQKATANLLIGAIGEIAYRNQHQQQQQQMKQEPDSPLSELSDYEDEKQQQHGGPEIMNESEEKEKVVECTEAEIHFTNNYLTVGRLREMLEGMDANVVVVRISDDKILTEKQKKAKRSTLKTVALAGRSCFQDEQSVLVLQPNSRETLVYTRHQAKKIQAHEKNLPRQHQSLMKTVQTLALPDLGIFDSVKKDKIEPVMKPSQEFVLPEKTVKCQGMNCAVM
jgi:hypothetical protein